jgi:hypothetical protein
MKTGKALRDKLTDKYMSLINRIKDENLAYVLSGFAPHVGSKFETSQSCLFFCGRAVDGWRTFTPETLRNDNAEIIVENIFQVKSTDVEAGCEMNWILRNRKAWSDGNKNGSGKSYNYRRSSFWGCARDILKKLENNKHVSGEWPQLLAWSNVYKISPKRGNPSSKLRTIQIPCCEKILKEEIDYLKPKHILFVTGDWGKKIIASLGIVPNPDFEKYNNKTIVQFKGKLDDAKVIIANRPEGFKRADWINEVFQAYQEI